MASKIKKKRTSKYDSKEEILFWGLRLSRYASLDNPKIMSFKLRSKLYQSRRQSVLFVVYARANVKG